MRDGEIHDEAMAALVLEKTRREYEWAEEVVRDEVPEASSIKSYFFDMGNGFAISWETPGRKRMAVKLMVAGNPIHEPITLMAAIKRWRDNA